MFDGNYSWMLYGDDDTLFFIDSISELLQDFDPSLPYFITGIGLPSKSLGGPSSAAEMHKLCSLLRAVGHA